MLALRTVIHEDIEFNAKIITCNGFKSIPNILFKNSLVDIFTFSIINLAMNSTINGSGSTLTDARQIVGDDEKKQRNFMKEIRLRKGQRLSDKATKSLSQSIIPALNVICFSRFFSSSSVIGKGLFISFPIVAEAFAFPVAGRYSAPQFFGAFGRAVTNVICNNLPCSAAQRNPNPALVVPGVYV